MTQPSGIDPIINRMLDMLQAHPPGETVFNPWRDLHPDYDCGPEAPEIRRQNLRDYLRPRLSRCRYILVAEAVSYQGGRFSGIAMTSERLLLGHHPEVDAACILPGLSVRRSSRSDLSETVRGWRTVGRLGFAELTASVVWKAVCQSGISPLDVIHWNAFPFHPWNPRKGPLSNRTPTGLVKQGYPYIKLLREACPGARFLAVGNHAAAAMRELGLGGPQFRHPANGGAGEFTRGLLGWFQQNHV